jgi:hypothetical protein
MLACCLRGQWGQTYADADVSIGGSTQQAYTIRYTAGVNHLGAGMTTPDSSQHTHVHTCSTVHTRQETVLNVQAGWMAQ